MGKEKNIKGRSGFSTGPGVHTQMGHFIETTIQDRRCCITPPNGSYYNGLQRRRILNLSRKSNFSNNRRMSKVINYGDDSRKKLIKGINQLADAVVTNIRP